MEKKIYKFLAWILIFTMIFPYTKSLAIEENLDDTIKKVQELSKEDEATTEKYKEGLVESSESKKEDNSSLDKDIEDLEKELEESPEKKPEDLPEDELEEEANDIIFTENTELNAFINSNTLVKRIAGKHRIATSIEISKFLREKSSAVILTDSSLYADALSGSSLTKGKFPILLVNKTCSKMALDEIQRLGATKVIILGGPLAISTEVEKQLEEIGLLKDNIRRIAGKDRYETSFEISKEFKKDNIIFTTGDNFPDGLAASSFAHSIDANLVLMAGQWSQQNDFLHSESTDTFVIGGSNAINSSLIPGDKSIMAGNNRYETAVLLAEKMKKDFIIITSGENFPDALSVSSLAIGLEAPILLTANGMLPKATIEYLREHRGTIKKVLLAGGENVISPLVYKNIEEILTTGKIQTLPAKDVSLFKNNKYVLSRKNTKLSGKIVVPAGKVCKVISLDGEKVKLQYNGKQGIGIVEDYGKNTIKNKKTIVPYISQLHPVYAPVGCEPVSLLMGLKGKGYAKNISTRYFLDNLPRHSSNPAKGYVGSPYKTSETLRTTIDPEPLAKYGSKYGDVSNIQAASIDDIIMELDNGNPVVVYVTLFWEKPYYREFKVEGKKKVFLRNNHALLLTGYNKDKKTFHIADPYNHEKVSAGRYRPYFYEKSRSILEPLYNIRKYAVVVR